MGDSRLVELDVDVRDRADLGEIFSRYRITTIFDLASITEVMLPKSKYAPNLEMTHSVVECALRCNVQKYVFFSTQLVFRREGTLPASDVDYSPIDDYGESKIQSEQLIRANLPKDRRLILRPTYVWGEEHRRFRDGFLYRLARGQMLLPARDHVVRYYGYVGTVCRQAAALAARPVAELPLQTFYLSDEPISMRKFCEYFIAALGQGGVWPVPAPIVRALGRFGDAAGALGVPFPIRALQANEMTRNYPVPIDATLALTGASTDYPRAVDAVVAWAISDPEFRQRIGR
jgi:nucleoside-diphosphate-sugar epimerase